MSSSSLVFVLWLHVIHSDGLYAPLTITFIIFQDCGTICHIICIGGRALKQADDTRTYRFLCHFLLRGKLKGTFDSY